MYMLQQNRTSIVVDICKLFIYISLNISIKCKFVLQLPPEIEKIASSFVQPKYILNIPVEVRIHNIGILLRDVIKNLRIKNYIYILFHFFWMLSNIDNIKPTMASFSGLLDDGNNFCLTFSPRATIINFIIFKYVKNKLIVFYIQHMHMFYVLLYSTNKKRFIF